MTISVRMDAVLEKELELIARQRGITKSQFIIEAVERALGHKDPYQLLLQVREEAPVRGAEAPASVAPLANVSTLSPAVEAEARTGASTAERVRQKLRARHAAASADWSAGRRAPPSMKDPE